MATSDNRISLKSCEEIETEKKGYVILEDGVLVEYEKSQKKIEDDKKKEEQQKTADDLFLELLNIICDTEEKQAKLQEYITFISEK